MTVNRRAPKAKNAQCVGSFREWKFLLRKKWFAGSTGAINRALPFEQGHFLIEPREPVGGIWPSQIQASQRYLKENERSQAQDYDRQA